MKNNRSQTGTALSWFVGSMAVLIILFFFFLFGFGRTIVQQTIQGKPSITTPDIEVFHKSEQQRQLFVLFEEESESKSFYDIQKNFVGIIDRKKIPSESLEETKRIHNALIDLGTRNKNKNICFNFHIQNEGVHTDISGAGSGVVLSERIYYLIFKGLSFYSNSDLENLGSLTVPIKSLGISPFFYPEKPFVGIYYSLTKCSEEKENEK